VDLTATFQVGALAQGCYDVVEQVPSGLAPIDVDYWRTDESDITWPSSVVGQEVTFCAANDPKTGSAAHLRYVARIVNEGVFTWEPAIMQLAGAPEALAFTPATSAVIAAP